MIWFKLQSSLFTKVTPFELELNYFYNFSFKPSGNNARMLALYQKGMITILDSTFQRQDTFYSGKKTLKSAENTNA